ncbi:hypothetical protein H4219_004420 [Mycoemilia scoparia]|uniref:Ras-related protein Rab-18 n=1 Tax=Mycoemilia scoparia TaxID=417184 RepID=A0A9W7ZRR5_9FUNG|nr:hypothetical protein H4219_004420 [Mycoemilia scoparia]
MNKNIEATFKLLFIGDSGVGKSSILLRFTDNCFLPPEDTGATIGVDFKVKVQRIQDKKYKVTIWDTAGQERFRTLTSSYYRGAQGVMLVYDVTDRSTFTELEKWFDELNTFCADPNIVKMVVGNKIDMAAERQVSKEEGDTYAKNHGALYYECSAKTSLDVDQAIKALVSEIIQRPTLWKKSAPSSSGSSNLFSNSNGNTRVGSNGGGGADGEPFSNCAC